MEKNTTLAINVLKVTTTATITAIKIPNQKLTFVQNTFQKQYARLVYQGTTFQLSMARQFAYSKRPLRIVIFTVEPLKIYAKNATLLTSTALLK